MCANTPARISGSTKEQGAGAEQSLASAVERLFADRWRWVPLVGLLVGAAVLALHATLVPFYLQVVVFSEPSDLGLVESSASLALFFAAFAAAVLTDAVGDRACVRAMLLAGTVSALGLRLMAEVLTPAHAKLAVVGMFASHAGVGALLGFVVPLVGTRPRPLEDGAVKSADAAATAAAVGVALNAGDVLGSALQLLLFPWFDYHNTVNIFAAILATYTAAAAFIIPGWLRPGTVGEVWATAAKAQSNRHLMEAQRWSDERAT